MKIEPRQTEHLLAGAGHIDIGTTYHLEGVFLDKVANGNHDQKQLEQKRVFTQETAVQLTLPVAELMMTAVQYVGWRRLIVSPSPYELREPVKFPSFWFFGLTELVYSLVLANRPSGFTFCGPLPAR